MIHEPTFEQIKNHEIVYRDHDEVGYACWYPQMGGYVGKCVIVLGPSGCFSAYVWHDGEFPFEGSSPVNLHHCDPQQFIEFGELVKQKQQENGISND